MRYSLLILLLCGGGVLARDPFQPVATSLCKAVVAPLTGWRLQGIVGREAHYHAWLLTPQGQSIMARSGRPFPVAPWQPAGIRRHSITLVVPDSCEAQQTRIYLKGGAHDKDSPAAAGPERPAAGLRRR
ncbi:DUF2531 domain-containing protein [uncultured Pantoea sp.]|uniref:DUF2531 domain-containing protein n=1 Tax=uncultured Pantoea sp. TaxID=218084 RepID=UPI0025E8817A|nr:DUF2531 domain-containing protein [uncultured Pantoea sp.]